MAIGEIEFRRLDICLILLDKPLVLLDQEFLIRHLLHGDAVLATQDYKTLQVRLRLIEQPLVMGELPLRKIERRLKGPRIDLRQKIALVDELAFLEANLHQLAIDLRLDRNGGERRDRSEAYERLIHLTGGDFRGADRLDILRRPLLRGAARPKKTPGANPDDRGDDQEDNRRKASPALWGLCWLRLLNARKDRLLNLGLGGSQHLCVSRGPVGGRLGYNCLVLNHIARTKPSPMHNLRLTQTLQSSGLFQKPNGMSD